MMWFSLINQLNGSCENYKVDDNDTNDYYQDKVDKKIYMCSTTNL